MSTNNNIESNITAEPGSTLCPTCRKPCEVAGRQSYPTAPDTLYSIVFCQQCGTLFRTGNMVNECSRCGMLFPDDPYDDVNSFYSHWCDIDLTFYCTPCYLNLFFNGRIDLSLDNPDVDRATSRKWEIAVLWCIYVEGSISRYLPRLKARGFEQVAEMDEPEFDRVRETCGDIAKAGNRYLVLIEFNLTRNTGSKYIVFQTNKENAVGFPEMANLISKN